MAMVSVQPSRTSSHGGGGGAGPSQKAHVRSHEPAMPPPGAKSAAQVMKPLAMRCSQPSRASTHGASSTSTSPTPSRSSSVHIPWAFKSPSAARTTEESMPTQAW